MGLIRTPHAAVIVWNYDDRVSVDGITNSFDKVNELIISTVSLMSISTYKSKGDPVGNFNFMLAPTRNWTSVLTPGSWCAILMADTPLDKSSFQKAKHDQVKMLGRIDTVRVDVSVDSDGARSTRYIVAGRDWGSIFSNIVYVDPLVQDPSDQGKTMANALYQQFSQNVFSANNDVLKLTVPKNLQTILSVFGGPIKLPETERLAKATHDISLPSGVSNYFNFVDGLNTESKSTSITKLLNLVWGPLKNEDDYDNSSPDATGTGWLDPGAMTGQHPLWSILQENCNHAMNELYPEIRWIHENPQLRLYARIKPFSYTNTPAAPDQIDPQMRSMFQNIYTHKLDDESIINVNAGTNWADKYNFLEIKADINELQVLGMLLKARSQAYQGTNSTSEVFDREGFRPIIFSIRQLPFNVQSAKDPLNADLISKWVHLAKEWYFDSHKLLNGTIVLTGRGHYIPVGDNIMFDAGLIGVTPNYNSGSPKKDPIYVLGHVETVQNNFSISADGDRSFQTIIQFVRGIFVDAQKRLIGEGTIDTLASALSKNDSKNNVSVLSVPHYTPGEE